MRAIANAVALALSIAAPLSASAAATYTSPLNTLHRTQPTEVLLTFENHTSQDREVVIGNQLFKVEYNRSIRLAVPVGSVVRVYSEMNSKLNGQQLLQVSTNDANRTIELK